MGQAKESRRKPKPHEAALAALKAHYLLGPVANSVDYYAVSRCSGLTRGLDDRSGAYCRIRGAAAICYDDTLRLPQAQWLGVLSLATLVLALGGPRQLQALTPLDGAHTPWDRQGATPIAWQMAVQLAALHWWRSFKLGELPEAMQSLPPEVLSWGRLTVDEIVQRLRAEPDAGWQDGAWTLTRSALLPLMPAMHPDPPSRHAVQPPDLEQAFAQALVDNARRALQVQHQAGHPPRAGSNPHSTAARAKRWLIAHYPLLGSLLTQFELVEDAAVCQRMDIRIAAIHVGAGEIYINPLRQLNFEAAKFVVAHEVLHAGLCHASRRQGRDRYLWNVACDFVINDWLVTMGVGIAPEGGLLFDEELRGWAAEDIYLRLAADLRVRRRLATLRGGDCDLLDDSPGSVFTDREAFCRQALMQGLDYHQFAGRGSLPASLVEAIRVLNQPPIPWQARLAEWIRERFAAPERLRSYARPSRRQSVTPEFPRPRHVAPDDERATRTFGVVIDSSGSMQRDDLGKALGAVVSYSMAQEVRQVRLVYCDAQPYDEGFVDIESLATRVNVRGRGGTVLQPAVSLLQTRSDFPKGCPILIITDGFCEEDLQVARDHAFLLTSGGRLPFVTRAPVFRMA